MPLPSQLFVSGTDTDIGKTVVSGVLVAGLKARYWKPVQTGLRDGTDSDWIRARTGIPAHYVFPETYTLEEPLSPHAAAALEDVHIDLDDFSLPRVPPGEALIVEGAGGIMVPLNKDHYMLDLVKRLGLPVLLVATSGLGTINHTLLSLAQLRRSDIEIAGVVMNGPRNPGNREAIERYGAVDVVAEVEPLDELNSSSLAACFEQCF